MFARVVNEPFQLCPVSPSHTRTADGVRFNVQTVDDVGPALVLERQESVEASLFETARSFYWRNNRELRHSEIRQCLRVYSILPNTIVTDFRHPSRSLAHIALTAFAKHYPLSLRPDDIWLLMTYAVAKHVNLNAEALRDKFVSFEGKRKLQLFYKDLKFETAPVSAWENDIFPKFSTHVRCHVGRDVHNLLTQPFTTTRKVDTAAAQVTLMAMTKSYFDFKMHTLCGIPFLELQGTLQDWQDLRTRAEQLKSLLMPDFADFWIPHLLPVLDEFVEAFKGNVNHEFWQRMVKKVTTGESGQSIFVSGWINMFYPYLCDGVNRHVQPWAEMTTFSGPEPCDFPEILSSVPVVWEDHVEKKSFNLHFHAGYVGMTQDENTLALRPHIGWFVTQDPQG